MSAANLTDDEQRQEEPSDDYRPDFWVSIRPDAAAGDDEWESRLNFFLSDPGPKEWLWLSFVDPDLPKGERPLGVCIVPAANVVQGVKLAYALGCNPGGEVAAYPCMPAGWRPLPEYVGRLLKPDAARALAGMPLASWAEEVER